MSEPVGALGDEASKLFAAAEQWWRDAHDRGHPDDDAAAAGRPECAVCPICQLLSALRESRPELFEHLSAAASSLMQAVRSTFESSVAGGAPREDGPAVERIDIR